MTSCISRIFKQQKLYFVRFYPIQKLDLDKYRDIFLIGCYVGLRVSDLLRIRKEHFYTVDGKEILRIRTKKCPTGVHIPFLWQDLKFRLDKYDYSLPKVTEQHL